MEKPRFRPRDLPMLSGAEEHGLQPHRVAIARAGAGRATRHPSGPSAVAAALRAAPSAFNFDLPVHASV